MLDTRIGSVQLARADGQTFPVFAAGSTANEVNWSPDSQRLLVVRTNYKATVPGTAVVAAGPIEIWLVRVDSPQKPVRVFQSAPQRLDSTGFEPGQIRFGYWSPNSRYMTFWQGALMDSADGLPLWLLDATAGKAVQLAETALENIWYQSWASDSSGLVFTSGGYRSAQVRKWLSLYDVKTGKVSTIINQKEAVPGNVAWSPKGNLIAYAAVLAADSGAQYADYMGFDNAAILKRRVYLLDPKTGKHWRLNNIDAFQDAPAWSADGSTLYFVQREGDDMVLIAANPSTGQGQVIQDSRRPAPLAVGYYGQSHWDDLLAYRPGTSSAPVPALVQTYTDNPGGHSIQYPAGWFVGRGWSYLIYSCSQCVTISPTNEKNPTDYGPFSGKLFLSIETSTQADNDMDRLLTRLLASPGLGQIVDRGAILKAFDRRATTVGGQAVTRLETMGEFGEVNHMLVMVNNGRAVVLRGQGDGRLFDAMAASLRL